jgi:hypothetical protein
MDGVDSSSAFAERFSVASDSTEENCSASALVAGI